MRYPRDGSTSRREETSASSYRALATASPGAELSIRRASSLAEPSIRTLALTRPNLPRWLSKPQMTVRPQLRPRRPFTALSQEEADLALARVLQERVSDDEISQPRGHS